MDAKKPHQLLITTVQHTKSITKMDPKIYKAAAKGNLQEVLEQGSRDQLDEFLTVNKNTILHICILSILVEEKFPATGGTDPVSAARFVEDVLNQCPSLLLKANAEGDTLLHVAARYGHASIVEVLIKHKKSQHQDLETGVQVDQATTEMIGKQNKKGDTALHEAVRYNYIEVVKHLLMVVDQEFPFGANAAGETPLYLAAKGRFPDLVSEIINKFMSPAYDGPLGETALHAAAFWDDEGMTQNILERYGGDLCKQADQKGWTPLHMAAYKNNIEATKLLLKSDVEVAYVKDAEGRTALHIAAYCNNSLVTEVIISMCPDCGEVVDNKGRNALHLAVMTKLRPDVALIIQDNSSLQNLLNQKDNDGNTPLHLYCNSDGYHKRVLTSPRVDKMVFNKENQTAYQILGSKNFLTGDDLKKMKNIFEDREDYRFFNNGRVLEVGYADNNMKELKGEDVKLKQEREKQMEEEDKAAQVHLVAAVLITTVTFAAGINMPGGFIGGDDHPHPGSAVLEQSVAFKVFIITNALALMLSSSAVFIHLFIPLMPSEDLFKTRTRFLQLAFWFLLSSMAPMVLAFVTAYRGAIIAMDPKIYKAAVKGNLEVLEHDISHPLDGFLTVNQITILHICISSILVEEEFRLLNQVSSLMGLEHDISHPRAALMIQDNSSLRNLLNQKDNHGNTPLHHYSKCFWYHERLLNSPRVDKMVFNKENQNAYQILTSKSFPTDDDDDKMRAFVEREDNGLFQMHDRLLEVGYDEIEKKTQETERQEMEMEARKKIGRKKKMEEEDKGAQAHL